ncbi:hypothetical protein AC1031_013164 [Aphanomyces cochlioides]|nr:hypothetical protein AC1031_013164 [Aphanomyces cochlioides]
MTLQTPHMVSIGMYSFWPTALENPIKASVDRVTVPQSLYQRVVDDDDRHHRAFGFIRESYRAWRYTALEVKRAKAHATKEEKAQVDIKQEVEEPSSPLMENESPRSVDVDLVDDQPSLSFLESEGSPMSSAANADKKRKFRKCGTSNATRVLRDWLFDPHNQEHPYPSEQEKRRLSQESGLTIKQIGIWFRNARQRLCQPTSTKATINQEQATAFMNVVGLRIDDSTPLRRGAWSPAENAYAQKLIDQFTRGKMPLVEGTPLRSFLAVVLHCHAMRISKKFVRDCSVGKITFRRDRMFDASSPEFESAMQELLALKAMVQDNAVVASKKTMETEQEVIKVQTWFRTSDDEADQLHIDTTSATASSSSSNAAAAATLPAKLEEEPDMHQIQDDNLLDDLDFDFDGVLGWGELDKAVSQIFFP